MGGISGLSGNSEKKGQEEGYEGNEHRELRLIPKTCHDPKHLTPRGQWEFSIVSLRRTFHTKCMFGIDVLVLQVTLERRA